jgi:hypothetical protein
MYGSPQFAFQNPVNASIGNVTTKSTLSGENLPNVGIYTFSVVIVKNFIVQKKGI